MSTTARRSTSRYRRLASLLGQLAFPHSEEAEVVEVTVSEPHAALVASSRVDREAPQRGGLAAVLVAARAATHRRPTQRRSSF
jgi:hypothetical protein